MRRNRTVHLALLLAATSTVALAAGAAHTQESDPAQVGQLSPLIPLPKDAIHAGLSWTPDSKPKICFGMRPAEYVGHHLVDEHRDLKNVFQELVYGGFGFSTGPHGLDQSVANSDIDRDNFVCWDLTHPDAFKDTGQLSILDENGNPLVTRADLALTANAMSDAGHSAGLDYNIFCAGNVALADGRWAFIGGHDKSGNNGIAKITIFDPVSETWVDRGTPPVKEDFLADPEGEHPEEHADALDETNTDPPHPSDMKYQRWYPTSIVLPDKSVLILSGTDQDSSLGPAQGFGEPCTDPPENAPCSKVRVDVPEIYDPKTDSTIALENAAKLQPMYVRSYVIQTGRGRHDWKVAAVGEVHPDFFPSLEEIGGYDPFYYTGDTYLLDVRAAVDDRNREVPGENHWEFLTSARIAHDSGASVQIWELDHEGWAKSQKVALFGGGCGEVPEDEAGEPRFPCDEATVEMIDFEDENPSWQLQEPLIQPASQNNAVVLPNGKALIVGGAQGRGPWENSFQLQLFDPEDGSITPLVETKIPRHDHSTVALLADGSVAIMGGNATDLANDPARTEAGVPNAQIYKPSYFFGGPRPVIDEAPDKLRYGTKFKISISDEGATKAGSVVLQRIGPVTHNWDWDNRHVKLWFEQDEEQLQVRAPAAPGLAVPGYYLLFVVSEEGVPSHARVVHLDYRGRDHAGNLEVDAEFNTAMQ
jgi:Galactose oxidase-like, Early set domain